ncbi:MAG: MopE-related protein, partial [Myxococcaceae bacterium]|nr:MopE-related protein [Myxococcaceae bacterium]
MRSFFLLLLASLSGCTCAIDRIQVVRMEEDAGTPVVDCVPATEVCNGLDDDCDGEVDEALPAAECGVGACRRTVPTCVNGAPQTCTPGMPKAESCNGLDDDCNGAVDENLMPTTCGVGECAAVSATCAMGRPVACMPAAPGTESCNGKDDDCDGTVDEGLLQNVSGDLRLTTNDASSDFVYLGASPQGFGVVWQDKRDGSAMNGDIYFLSLDKQGRRLGGDLRVSSTSGVSTHPSVAFGNGGWGLIYADDTVDNLELYYRPLTPTGQPGGAPVRLTASPGDSDWPDVVWTGTEFAIAWEDERAGANRHDIYFMRIDATGSRLGPEVRVTTDPNRQSYPILKYSGQGYGLAWTDWRDGNR